MRERMEAASQEPGVRGLPQDHGSDRPGARELRRDRPVAGQRRSARVDPAGELYDGTKLDGPASLRQALLNHSDAFRAGLLPRIS